MADRKQTPDILGEIMGGISTAPVEDILKPAKPAKIKRAAAVKKAVVARAVPEKKAAEKPVTWEYLLVSFQDHSGWRPRFLNGKQQPDWMDAPVIHEYLQQLGKDGWEIAGASAGQSLYGSADKRQVYFKRPRK